VHPVESFINIRKIYPNPFNPQVTVEYEIQDSDQVSIYVRDLKGQHIKTINQLFKSKGRHRVSWRGDNDYGLKVSSGLYFLSIKAGNSIKTAKVLLLE
jgi:flagellar hook assembly protein FlgD